MRALPKTILVTGAAGFVGRHLLRIVAESSQGRWDAKKEVDPGHTWIGSDREEPAEWWGQPSDMRFVAADLEDQEQVDRLVGDTDPSIVVHLAGRTLVDATPDDCARSFGANLMSTCNLLQPLRRLSGKHGEPTQFILCSTGQVYGDQSRPFSEEMDPHPPDDYGLSKLLAEQSLLAYAREQSIRACILRPAVLYGPRQTGETFIPTLVATLNEGRRFAMTGGDQRQDFLFVDDMVRAILLAIRTSLVGTYNVGSGQAVPLRSVGELAARLFEHPELLGGGELPDRNGKIRSQALDSSRLQRVGWRAQVGLEEGIRRTIERARMEKQP